MITVKRDPLTRAAEWVTRGLSPQGPTINLLALDGVLTLRASNFDVEVMARVPYEGDEFPEVNLPGAVFSNVVKTMRGQDVKLSAEGKQVVVHAGSRATFNTSTSAPAAWGRGDIEHLTTLPAVNLRACLGWASMVVSKDDMDKSWMSGIRMVSRDGLMEFRGGNRFSIGRALLDCPDDMDVAGPAVMLAQLARGLSGDVKVGLRNGVLVLGDGTLSGSVRTFNDPGWPDLPKLWTPPTPCSVVVDRNDLLAALTTVTVGGDVVALTVQADHLEVASSHGLDFNKDEAAQITDTVSMIESEGQPSWRFNPALLVPALKGLQGEQVRLGGAAGASAVMVTDWPEAGLYRTIMAMRGGA